MIGFYHLNKHLNPTTISGLFIQKQCYLHFNYYSNWSYTPLKIYQKELTTVCEKGTLQSLLWSSLFQEFFKGYKLRSKNTTKILEEIFPCWSELFIIMFFSVLSHWKVQWKSPWTFLSRDVISFNNHLHQISYGNISDHFQFSFETHYCSKPPKLKYKTKQFKVDQSKTTQPPALKEFALWNKRLKVIYANTKIILTRIDLRLRYSYQRLSEL